MPKLMRNLVFSIIFSLPAFAFCEPLRVFVSVLPQKTLVEAIGGEHVDVRAMVRPGHNPHTYDPTPRQIAALTEAVLYVRIGVPFEHSWMGRIRATNPRMQVLDVREGIAPHTPQGRTRLEGEGRRSGHGEGHDHEDHDGSLEFNRASGETVHGIQTQDPHLWTSPVLVKRMSARIRDRLSALDPANAPVYARNHDIFVAELDTLDRDIRKLLDGVPNRRFMVFHPAWGYFADTYGLEQVSIQREGKEPGPRALAALIEQAKREGVKVIFVQPQFSKQSAQQVANAIGGHVVAVDPLSPDYLSSLRTVARQIAEAARQ